MLVPIIPVKTLAKMLLILMMGPSDKAPYTVTLSKDMAPSVSLVQMPNGYYQLQCAGSNESVYFSGAQLQSIVNNLPSEAQYSISTGGRIDLNKFAAYIIRNELSFMGSAQLPREYDDRSSASSGPRNTVVIGASVSVNKPQNDNRKMYKDFDYTFSPEKIKCLIQQGDVRALLSEQRNILKALNMRVGDKKTRAILTEWLDHVDKALIDWGSLTPELQKHRSLQKQAKVKELKAQLQLTKDRLANPIRCWWHRERKLKLEQYYLEKILKDPITQWLHVIAHGEGPESSEGFKILNKQWSELTLDQRAIIEKQVGFHPIRVAHSLIALRPNNQPTIHQNQPTDLQAGSATYPLTTTDVPTTTAATGPGTTTTSTSTIPMTDINASSILDPERNPVLDQMALDMVTTGPKYLPISPETLELINSKLAEVANTYQADDPLLSLETLNNTLQGILGTYRYNQISPEKLQEFQAKESVGLNDFVILLLPFDQQCKFHFVQALVDTVTDIKGFLHANASLAQMLVEGVFFGDAYDLNIELVQDLGQNTQMKKFIDAVSNINLDKVSQHIALMSPQEKCRVLGTIAGAYMQGKILAGAIPTALKGIENITQVVAESRVGQSVAQSVETLAQGATRIGTAEEVIAVTAEGIPVAISTGAQETMSFKDAAQKVGSAAQKTEGLLISVTEQAVVKNLADSFVATARQDIPRLRQIFDGKFKGFGDFANKFLKFDYEHILGMELEFTRRGVPKIKGFHHDFMETIEKSGVLEFANKKILENGFYKAEIRCLGHKVKDISFFPATWSREQVIDKIIEACKNFVKSGAEIPWEPGGKCSIKALTNEGVEIQVFITKNGAITSAYPVL